MLRRKPNQCLGITTPCGPRKKSPAAILKKDTPSMKGRMPSDIEEARVFSEQLTHRRSDWSCFGSCKTANSTAKISTVRDHYVGDPAPGNREGMRYDIARMS